MKKLISLLLVFLIFVIGSFSTTMANFVMPEMEMNKSIEFTTVNTSDYCNDMSSSFSDCSEDKHECCFSPLKDSIINGVNISKKEDKKIKGKILDFNLLAFIQDSLEYNYIEKLTSPPKSKRIEIEENFYISLIGIIKSNC